MKILLIAPPLENMINSPSGEVVDEEEGKHPPLGLMYIAAYLEKYSNHVIEIMDCPTEKIDYKKLKQEIIRRRPDVVGISVTSFTLLDAVQTAKIVKEVNKNIHVNFGGPHANIFPEETIKFPFVDSLIIGEGEITFYELANALEKNINLKNIKGIVYKNKKIFNKPREPIDDLDKLPFPARHLTPFKKYYSAVGEGSLITTMITSRGCPYNCLFCSNGKKKLRLRSADNIIEEIKQCIKMGIKEFYLFDDTFNVSRKRVIELAKKIIENKLDIKWGFRARVNNLDKEVLFLLKKSGCNRINLGVEAGTQEILDVLRKGITLKQVKDVFKMTKKFGIKTVAYFMIGSPNETKWHVKKTIKLVKELCPDFIVYSITTPYPGTDLYKMGQEKGLFKDFWREFAKNPKKDFVPELWTKELSQKELFELQRFAYKKFYLNPNYILKRLLQIRSFNELKTNLNIGLKMINFAKSNV